MTTHDRSFKNHVLRRIITIVASTFISYLNYMNWPHTAANMIFGVGLFLLVVLLNIILLVMEFVEHTSSKNTDN